MTETPEPSSSSGSALSGYSGTLRERLLVAALDALRGLDAEALLHAVGAREIARRAGASSPGSVNQHYGSLSGLADAVVNRIFDTAHLNVPRISELIGHIKDAALPLPVAFAMHEAEFNRLTNDPEFKLRMGLWALGGESVRERYRDYLAELTAQLEQAAGALFESWGRELRPPVDLGSYLAIKLALINGMTVRHLTDPADEHLYLFQRSTVAIDLALLRVLGDRHDLDARLTELNYYPLQSKQTGRQPRNHRTEARILRAANELFHAQGVEETGTDQIARHADTSLSTLKRLYPTKQALAVALFSEQAVEHGLGESLTDVGSTSLRDHVGRLVEFARARPAIGTTYLSHLVTSASSHGEDPVIAHTRSRLPESTDHDADDLSETLVLLAIRRAITHPSEPADETAQQILGRLGLADAADG